MVHSPCLGGQPLGITWEHGGLTDVPQTQIQHENSLQSDTTASVGWTSVAERIDVRADRLQVNLVVTRSFRQKLRIVDSLSTGEDFLTAHKHVVGVAQFVVVWVRHCIEWTHSEWIFIQDVEICVILGFYKFSKELLVGCAQIILVPNLHPVLTQHLHSLRKCEHQTWLKELERLARELLAHRFDFMSISVTKPLEDCDERVPDGLHNLVVVIVECHLDVQTDKLGKMTMCVGVLGSEHTADGVDTIEVRCDTHLFVQLWGLCEVRAALEV